MAATELRTIQAATQARLSQMTARARLISVASYLPALTLAPLVSASPFRTLESSAVIDSRPPLGYLPQGRDSMSLNTPRGALQRPASGASRNPFTRPGRTGDSPAS